VIGVFERVVHVVTQDSPEGLERIEILLPQDPLVTCPHSLIASGDEVIHQVILVGKEPVEHRGGVVDPLGNPAHGDVLSPLSDEDVLYLVQSPFAKGLCFSAFTRGNSHSLISFTET
jgi:hypothetical protein